MAKSAKQTPKKPVSKGKKAISKAKSAPAKTSSAKTSSKKSSKSSKNIKWAAPYEKKIKMFKSQGDYFALNEKYASK